MEAAARTRTKILPTHYKHFLVCCSSPRFTTPPPTSSWSRVTTILHQMPKMSFAWCLGSAYQNRTVYAGLRLYCFVLRLIHLTIYRVVSLEGTTRFNKYLSVEWKQAIHKKIQMDGKHKKQQHHTSVRCNFSSTGLANLKRFDKPQCCWGCGKMGTIMYY